MNLYKLAFTSYICNYFTSFNQSHQHFRLLVGNIIDLSIPEHRKALIAWLNTWGYGQVVSEYLEAACDEILAWYEESLMARISQDKKLWELEKQELEQIVDIYDALAGKVVPKKYRGNRLIATAVGPTGASRIFFALRPEIFAPWDEAIRNALDQDSSGNSYVAYLQRIKAEIEELAVSCGKSNLQLYQVPHTVGRSNATITQLVGDYFWVTETRKFYPPSSDLIQCWARWDQAVEQG
jgi:hypothetical protein